MFTYIKGIISYITRKNGNRKKKDSAEEKENGKIVKLDKLEKRWIKVFNEKSKGSNGNFFGKNEKMSKNI